ncbi:hypothetical protein IAT38_007615 [Cryptococcus sp. DSM 104549]
MRSLKSSTTTDIVSNKAETLHLQFARDVMSRLRDPSPPANDVSPLISLAQLQDADQLNMALSDEGGSLLDATLVLMDMGPSAAEDEIPPDVALASPEKKERYFGGQRTIDQVRSKWEEIAPLSQGLNVSTVR